MFKVLVDGCEPTRGSKYSACVDLYASEDVVIGAGETKLISLGVCIDYEKLKVISDRDLENHAGMAIDEIISGGDGDADIVYYDAFRESHYLQLMLRSSLGKKGLILPNGVGVIDMDYKDEIKMIIHNPIKNGFLFKVVQTLPDKAKEFANMSVLSNAVTIKKGDRIAQITLVEHKSYLFGISSDTERTGGFGSTDEKN